VNIQMYAYNSFCRFLGFLEDKWLIISHFDLKIAFAIKSHLTPKERVTLYDLSINSKFILEIGSYIGASACCFGASRKKSGEGKVFCIDTWNNNAMTEGNRDTYDEFITNTAPFSKFIIPVRGLSTDVTERVTEQVDHLDLLFIDGDHSYSGVKADWETYKHFLRSGSIVVFHDSGWSDGVRRVIAEEVKPLVCRSDCLPNMWWGVIKQP